MNFVIAAVFDNYINAHVTMGRLQEEHINCWLKDENTVSTYPGSTYAVGGIKLMVAEAQIERALALIAADRQEYRQQHPCPQCGSENIGLVSIPRKPGNWLGTITSAVLGIEPTTPADKVYHCSDCGKEYEIE